MILDMLEEGKKIRARLGNDVLYSGTYVAHMDRHFKIQTDAGHFIVFDAFVLQIDVEEKDEWVCIGSPSDEQS